MRSVRREKKIFPQIAANEWEINVFWDVVQKQILCHHIKMWRKTFELNVISRKTFT
jgi:hypothetical protein